MSGQTIISSDSEVLLWQRLASDKVRRLGASGRAGQTVLTWSVEAASLTAPTRRVMGRCYALVTFPSGRREIRGYYVVSEIVATDRDALPLAMAAGERRFGQVRNLGRAGFFLNGRRVRPIADVEWVTLREAAILFRPTAGESVQ